jgi:hypothetical protein
MDEMKRRKSKLLPCLVLFDLAKTIGLADLEDDFTTVE